jgi:predicted ester cyclase
MSEENKTLIRRYIEEVINAHNPDAADKFVVPDYIEHDMMPPGTPPGLEGLKESLHAGFQAFPDVKATEEWIVAERDMVAIHVTYSGTHKGEFIGIAPTGKAVTWTDTHSFRIFGGKVVEYWTNGHSWLSMAQQLGAIPS